MTDDCPGCGEEISVTVRRVQGIWQAFCPYCYKFAYWDKELPSVKKMKGTKNEKENFDC